MVLLFGVAKKPEALPRARTGTGVRINVMMVVIVSKSDYNFKVG
jgi:hypothetical protein